MSLELKFKLMENKMPYTIIDNGIVQSGVASVSVGGFKWVTGTILANELSVVVTHNLGSMPTGYSLVDNNGYAAGKLFVQRANILANTATIEITDAQPMDADFLFGVTA